VKKIVLLVTALLAFAACADPVESTPESDAPEACIEALDMADDLLRLAAEGIGYLRMAMEAALEFDSLTVDSANANASRVSSEIVDKTPAYRAAIDECRGE